MYKTIFYVVYVITNHCLEIVIITVAIFNFINYHLLYCFDFQKDLN